MKSYLERRALFPEYITEVPPSNLFNVIVIPCYNEPDIISTLSSLAKCKSPKFSVEIIIVINASAKDSPEVLENNRRTLKEIENFKNSDNGELFNIHVVVNNGLPKKHAGVGLARKLGMDEAVRRFDKITDQASESFNGIITCLDADCTVNEKYLVSIENYFINNSECPGVSIKYAHDISSNDENEKEIIDYELHLRYYNQALKYAGCPYAYQTVGSAMSVRCEAYQKQGGMNKRKAGEDFYFLHKFTSLDNFGHIRDAIVFPSSRVSERVPFGTGRAMLKMKIEHFETYHWSAFLELKLFVNSISDLYESISDPDIIVNTFPEYLKSYLKDHFDYKKDWSGIYKNTKSKESFVKRFFVWLDAFWVMKFLNFHRITNGGGDVDEEACKLLASVNGNDLNEMTNKELLLRYRGMERE